MDLLEALGQVGTAADKFTGGRALRGLAVGKPRELLSALPYSDTLGLTNEHDATSGRDVTNHYGITTKGDDSFGSHAAGFLADTLLNPVSLAGAGAAFKAAPTIGKGLVAGAKAATGLDLIDALRGAGTKAGPALHRFLADENGALMVSPRLLTHETLGTGARQGPQLHTIVDRFRDWPFNTNELTPWRRAVDLGREAGVRTEMPSSFGWNYLHSQRGAEVANEAAALFNGRTNQIHLNPNHPAWHDSNTMKALLEQQGPSGTGWMSSADPDHFMRHELGHAYHFNSSHIGFPQEGDKLGFFNPAEQAMIAQEVSRYGATKPSEAVAEIVAALMGERQLHTAVQEPLRMYGGRTLYNILGDAGLLRNAGWAGLGGAGLALAAGGGDGSV
jgi:hypothetical protein